MVVLEQRRCCRSDANEMAARKRQLAASPTPASQFQQPPQQVVPNAALLQLLTGDGGETTRRPCSIQQLFALLRDYVRRRELYDVNNPSVVHCARDPLGQLFRVDSFTVYSALRLLLYNVESIEPCATSDAAAYKRRKTSLSTCCQSEKTRTSRVADEADEAAVTSSSGGATSGRRGGAAAAAERAPGDPADTAAPRDLYSVSRADAARLQQHQLGADPSACNEQLPADTVTAAAAALCALRSAAAAAAVETKTNTNTVGSYSRCVQRLERRTIARSPLCGRPVHELMRHCVA